jgi:hypothetical protein
MNYKLQKIECPICHNPIFFDVKELMKGESFSCSECKCSVSLTSSSSKVVEETMEKYERLSIKQSVNK